LIFNNIACAAKVFKWSSENLANYLLNSPLPTSTTLPERQSGVLFLI
jgi:hypothetical protein